MSVFRKYADFEEDLFNWMEAVEEKVLLVRIKLIINCIFLSSFGIYKMFCKKKPFFKISTGKKIYFQGENVFRF